MEYKALAYLSEVTKSIEFAEGENGAVTLSLKNADGEVIASGSFTAVSEVPVASQTQFGTVKVYTDSDGYLNIDTE